MVLDGAEWHRPKDLEASTNLSLLRLQPYSPELNSIKTLIPILKHHHFASGVFEIAEHVREVVEAAWNWFIRRTAEIMQITAREWAVL